MVLMVNRTFIKQLISCRLQPRLKDEKSRALLFFTSNANSVTLEQELSFQNHQTLHYGLVKQQTLITRTECPTVLLDDELQLEACRHTSSAPTMQSKHIKCK